MRNFSIQISIINIKSNIINPIYAHVYIVLIFCQIWQREFHVLMKSYFLFLVPDTQKTAFLSLLCGFNGSMTRVPPICSKQMWCAMSRVSIQQLSSLCCRDPGSQVLKWQDQKTLSSHQPLCLSDCGVEGFRISLAVHLHQH